MPDLDLESEVGDSRSRILGIGKKMIENNPTSKPGTLKNGPNPICPNPEEVPKDRVPLTKASPLVIVVAMKNVTPWKEIYEFGQKPTWIREAKQKGFGVYRLESKKSSKFQDLIDKTVDARRHGRLAGGPTRLLLRFMDIVAPRRQAKWSEAEGEIPAIVEDSPDMMTLFHRRNLALFEWFLFKRSEDFLFRVNSSSYVILERLKEYLESQNPNEITIGGSPILDGQGRDFLSGAGLLFSRPAVEKLYKNWQSLRRDLPEDVGIGVLAKKLNLYMKPMRTGLFSADESKWEFLDNQEIFHVRCKGHDRPEEDIQNMIAIDRLLSPNRSFPKRY